MADMAYEYPGEKLALLSTRRPFSTKRAIFACFVASKLHRAWMPCSCWTIRVSRSSLPGIQRSHGTLPYGWRLQDIRNESRYISSIPFGWLSGEDGQDGRVISSGMRSAGGCSIMRQSSGSTSIGSAPQLLTASYLE